MYSRPIFFFDEDVVTPSFMSISFLYFENWLDYAWYGLALSTNSCLFFIMNILLKIKTRFSAIN